MPLTFKFNIKTRLIFSGILFILGIFIILQISLYQVQDISQVQAAVAHKVRGWGWSENIGWISMNCYNDYPECNGGTNNGLVCTSNADCPGGGTCQKSGDFENCCPGGNAADCPGGLSSDYGVHYNTTNGKLTGYAWSDGVGWVCFGETCQTVCLGGSNNGAACTIDGDCSGGVCGGKPAHGLPVSWACVGRPTWTCQGGSNNGLACFQTSTDCPSGLCRFGCSDDAGEDFVDSSVCVRSSHLKAHWKMNSLVTGTILDESNSNTGTLMPVNTPPIQAKGKFSNALQFDGTEDYIEVADSASLSVTGNLTIEAWVRRGEAGTEQTIVGKWDESTGIKSYRLWFSPTDNKLNFTVSDGTNTATAAQKNGICVGNDRKICDGGNNTGLVCNDYTATNDCPDGYCREPFCVNDAGCQSEEICKNAPITDTTKWHHITGKYVAQTSGNNPGLQLFIDGSPIHTGITGTIPNSLIGQSEKLYIGAKKGVTVIDTYFKGTIDNVSVWSCQNLYRTNGRSNKEIWDDARIELDGWGRVINLGEKGWLKLRGLTRDGRVWGSSLDDYSTFYILKGYMANRWVDTSMDSSGLVGHWKMDEPDWDGTSNEVVDASGNANHGTAYNGANVTNQGIFNSAGDFDGDNDYINIPNSAILDPGLGSYIGSAWIKTSISTGNTYIFGYYEGGATDRVEFRVQDGKVRILINDDGNVIYRDSLASVGDDLWHHVAFVWDTTADTLNIYVDGSASNGTLIGTPSNIGTVDPAGDLSIGRRNDNTGYFNGFIDNVAIYNRALTSTEIQQAYNKSTPACMGWEDHDHDYDDPPEPLDFNSLTVSNPDNCEQLLVYWDPSDWAEDYTYWRDQQDSADLCGACTSESTCTTSGYTEYNVLAGSCTETECSLSDTGLSFNTGYCYNITAYNETGSTWATDTPPTYPAPYWRSTTLCGPENLASDTDTCGQVTLTWDKGANTDGYNIYRSLATGDCDNLYNSGCELTGHLAEALDYDVDNDGTNDLIAQWKMNEASWNGTNKEVKDSSARTPLNEGTAECVGTCTEPTTIAGIFDRAGSFDGVDDYVTARDRAELDLGSGDNLTIEAWINLTSAPTGYNMIVSKGYDPGYEFRINSAKKLQFINVATGYSDYYITSDSSIATTDGTTWYHVAVTKNNTTGAAKLYINGVLDKAASMDVLDYSNNKKIRIGRDADDGSATGTAFFTGYIDNVSIYNVIKSAEQIRIDYESGINSNCESGQCGLAYVCDDGTEPHDKCGIANTCCYTDSRVIPYVNYYYRLTATGETGETPSSTEIGPAQTICFPAPAEEEE